MIINIVNDDRLLQNTIIINLKKWNINTLQNNDGR